MLRLEKIFQKDDSFFIDFILIVKIIIIYLSIYTYSIIESNTLFDLLNFKIYLNSNYFNISIYFTLTIFLTEIFFFKKNKFYLDDNKIFYKKNFIIWIISTIFILFLNKFNNLFFFNINFIYLIIFIFFNLAILKYFSFKIYKYLIDKNIIQRNIMLVGTYKNIKNFIIEKKNNINVYKCCIIFDEIDTELKFIRNEIKFPVFSIKDDIRSILEYHALGQIWILDDKISNINSMLDHILKFSVDILIVDISKIFKENLSLINSKYQFIEFEISRFYGSKLFIKILIDKFLSLFFLIILSPILAFSFFAIYLEDGFPLLFTQDRTGWDGRRFKIFKLRSLKDVKFDKTHQVNLNDNRLLKIGKFIRKYSIDEVPQFINVLIGDMSIVGPRPHMVEHDIYYSSFFKEFLKRHKTNPGLTGWAQVNGLRGATPTPEIMKKRMELDLWYLNNWTPLLDIWIIIKTFYVIFKHKGV